MKNKNYFKSIEKQHVNKLFDNIKTKIIIQDIESVKIIYSNLITEENVENIRDSFLTKYNNESHSLVVNSYFCAYLICMNDSVLNLVLSVIDDTITNKELITITNITELPNLQNNDLLIYKEGIITNFSGQ
ncbi:hypothetical protein Q763_17575 [Flavobacterium beibuense F44-8]|uniref:Uncharacterized protein n=1 Tax=Flavobacterium beibuense F44-8 TaxID=1406840 RepID=A0A0A2LHF3_9FLAO|nr:hypothetical protein [Flavobacterium beibuense]KGO78598.1 hypothetical protein Q763_17575 [Flavobacterium beibuense F44-8]